MFGTPVAGCASASQEDGAAISSVTCVVFGTPVTGSASSRKDGPIRWEDTERNSLVPLIDGVVVLEYGLDLDTAEEEMVLDGAVVDGEGDCGLLGGNVAGGCVSFASFWGVT